VVDVDIRLFCLQFRFKEMRMVINHSDRQSKRYLEDGRMEVYLARSGCALGLVLLSKNPVVPMYITVEENEGMESKFVAAHPIEWQAFVVVRVGNYKPSKEDSVEVLLELKAPVVDVLGSKWTPDVLLDTLDEIKVSDEMVDILLEKRLERGKDAKEQISEFLSNLCKIS